MSSILKGLHINDVGYAIVDLNLPGDAVANMIKVIDKELVNYFDIKMRIPD